MLKEYIEKRNFNLNDHLFAKVDTIRSVYRRTRKRTATKLKKPELLRISLYSFRYYYATMLYHKTKSILLVKQNLGHKRIENTLIYTHLIKFSEDEYITATATTTEQACKLIEQGFTKADEFNGIHIYKKRK